ncbi:MAG TPA: aldo/keto reductase, partial [Anaeromyxobacteraceae bacterium]|nr:aldo/keto reductase [Anaeromyxobacteraceae bacterium]
LRLAAAAAAAPALARASPTRSTTMLTRPVPSSGEALPAVGLGTWQTFDVGEGGGERAPLREVLRLYFDAGARVLDSSPMYGRSEEVVGDLLRGTPWAKQAFVATKVWTQGKEEGLRQIADSERKMGGRIDLLQIHNLLDWQVHLPTLRDLKANGRIRYLGVTHYALGAFDDLERIVRRETVDFVQLPYSVQVREAEARLLPAARHAGVAVLVMRPFEAGTLLRSLHGKPLPPFAAELAATSWAQLLLKWILAHPAVTAAIPATANPAHAADNLAAGRGPMPDEATRKRIAQAAGL